jgi:branched-chain amino acid transport system ATP-binding protein
VIGPNGAGKSTTLNALMGLLPFRGRIVFDGVDLADATLEERVMLGLALVPEKRELFGTMPVEDNLVLGGFRPMKLRVPNWREAGARLRTVPAPEGTPHATGRHAVRRRAPDAGGGPRADVAAQAADAGRAQPGPGAAGGARDLPIIDTPARTGRVHPAGRAERPRRAEVADYGYVLETGEISMHGPAARTRRRPARDRDLPGLLPDGARNAVCERIEEKMGLHGSPTCVLRFDDAIGWRVGEAGPRPERDVRDDERGAAARGAARHRPARCGLAEGRRLCAGAHADARARRAARRRRRRPIIRHPAMRRILDTERAWIDGLRLLAYRTGLELDVAHHPMPHAAPRAAAGAAWSRRC